MRQGVSLFSNLLVILNDKNILIKVVTPEIDIIKLWAPFCSTGYSQMFNSGVLTSIDTTAAYITIFFVLSKVRTFSQNIDSGNLVTGDLLIV